MGSWGGEESQSTAGCRRGNKAERVGSAGARGELERGARGANEIPSSPSLVLDLPISVELTSEHLPLSSGHPVLGSWLGAIRSNSGTVLGFSLLGFPSLSGEMHRHILTQGQLLLASLRLLTLSVEEILVI